MSDWSYHNDPQRRSGKVNRRDSFDSITETVDAVTNLERITEIGEAMAMALKACHLALTIATDALGEIMMTSIDPEAQKQAERALQEMRRAMK